MKQKQKGKFGEQTETKFKMARILCPSLSKEEFKTEEILTKIEHREINLKHFTLIETGVKVKKSHFVVISDGEFVKIDDEILAIIFAFEMFEAMRDLNHDHPKEFKWSDLLNDINSGILPKEVFPRNMLAYHSRIMNDHQKLFSSTIKSLKKIIKEKNN